MSALLDALAHAGADELRSVEDRIQSLESELASLRMVAKILQTRLGVAGGAAPKVASGTGRFGPTSRTQLEAWRRAVAAKLCVSGAMSLPSIAQACAIPESRLERVLDHPWFTQNSQGVHVTTTGRQAVA